VNNGFTGKQRPYTQEEIKNGWGKLGIVQHKQFCKKPVDWEDYEIIAQVRNSVKQELQIRESLVIKFRQTKPRPW
jgi:hypothetical protein